MSFILRFLVLTVLLFSFPEAQAVSRMFWQLGMTQSEADAFRCEQALKETEKQLGRKLTEAEKQAAVQSGINDLYKKNLEAPKKKSCFTGHMRVLTPNGLVRIDELRVGDTLISWDTQLQLPIENELAGIRVDDNRSFGRLQDLAKTIDVTSEHPFYTGGDSYSNVGAISSTTSIYRLNEVGTRLDPIPRGNYQFACGVGRVYDLSMGEEPRNFFVESILVHNKPLGPLF